MERVEDPDEAAAARDWLDWCEEHVRTFDPLQLMLRLPPDPDADHAGLAPFLDRPTYGQL